MKYHVTPAGVASSFALLMSAVGLVGCGGNTGSGDVDPSTDRSPTLLNSEAFRNPSGYAATYSALGDIDLAGPFFQALGTNGRTCASCHQPGEGWSIIPARLQERFDATDGTDPVFRLVDGANSPNADVSTVAARRAAYSMLLSKGLIRVGIGVPDGAEFALEAVDDPYGYASAAQLSLFRRPLPTTNLRFLSTVMWDARETYKNANSTTCIQEPVGSACFESIEFDCLQQASHAVVGHAEGAVLSPALRQQIVEFEYSLHTAQISTDAAGALGEGGARGGQKALFDVPTYFGINDNFGDYQTGMPFTPIVFDVYDAWSGLTGDGTAAARAAVARGQALFNTRQFTISGVGGLNGSYGLPDSFVGTCTTCHDTPNSGNHSIPMPLNIGLADASLATPDLPLYTLRNLSTGETVQTTDPGRALITGKWADIGRFKGPTLRGVASHAPYFHNGMAADLPAVINFYQTRFAIGFTDAERADLVAFLAAL